MDFRYKELSWKDICLDWDDFVFSLGKGYKMEGEVLTMFSALEREVTQFCKPLWGYRVFSIALHASLTVASAMAEPNASSRNSSTICPDFLTVC